MKAEVRCLCGDTVRAEKFLSQAGLIGVCVRVQRLLLLLFVVPVLKDRIPERKHGSGVDGNTENDTELNQYLEQRCVNHDFFR